MNTKRLAPLRNDFIAGLAVLLPAIISIAVVIWAFRAVSNITDKLLFAMPPEWKYVHGVRGEMHWYWSLAALLLALGLITLVGGLTRHYLGRKLIGLGDRLLLRMPLLNRIYGTLKQMKEAFAGNRSAFRQVVLVQFPRVGIYSLGFITGEQRHEVQAKTLQAVWTVFVPTTPNPIKGFLIYLPEDQLIRLEMSVADAIKSIISIGAVAPEHPADAPARPTAQE